MLAEDSLSTHVELHGDVTVLAVSGEIDLSTSAAFQAAILDALAKEPRAFILDLLQVNFFSSAGVTALVTTHQKTLRQLMSVQETLEDAVRAVQGDRAK